MEGVLDLLNQETQKWTTEQRLPYISYIAKIFRNKFKRAEEEGFTRRLALFKVPGLTEEEDEEVKVPPLPWEYHHDIRLALMEALHER